MNSKIIGAAGEMLPNNANVIFLDRTVRGGFKKYIFS